MKVRTKFTLWISLASFLAALFFSTFVFFEFIEEPYKLINRELLDIGHAVLNSTTVEDEPRFTPNNTDYPVERYWIKMTRENGAVIFASSLASSVDIPLQKDKRFYTITRKISPHHVWTDPQEKDDLHELKGDRVKFKVLVVSETINGEKITLMIAKPLAMFMNELRELIHELLLYVVLLTVLIVFSSYHIAGKILQPLNRINRQIKKIRENSLTERIPLGKSEDELHTLSVSLNSMFDRLHNSFQQQKEFVSSASHEMRSPLTILMLGHEEMLADKLPKKVEVELTKQITTLRRLNKLVKDLLDISLLERQEFIERTEIGLSALIEKVLEDFDEILRVKNIVCTVNTDRLKVLADHDKLLRIFINLIDNGIKYNNNNGGKIFIATRIKDKSVIISITNTGQTIPAEDLPYIFKQFYRVEKSRSQKYGGTGLGLTIVKRIVELHEETIWVESADNRTTVSFTLPVL